MAEPETLAALKRAYADTLLNTTKEAAARVLVSEKKARSYQQELVTVRDEALHTLLRLKHMFDSKVKETEMVSLKQQQKVEELEAQLGEAEDIVGELRLELRELRDELKKYLKSDHEEDSFRKNSDPEVSCSDERSGAVASCCIPVEQSGSVVANGIKIPSFTRRNSIKRCSSKGCHHTLPSILSKRREAEGCTQMIHTVIANGEVGDVNGVCLHRVPSCKSVENLEMPGCAAASDSTASVFNDVKDGEDSVSLKTSPRKHESDRKAAMGETEAEKEGKESCEDVEVSASPLCEETPVSAVNKRRCIKYTFQRKRKKEVLSNLDGDSSFEESRNMKQKTGEKKEDGYLESLKPSSSQDSLRVAQVAQQPVPFLEKKGLQAELVNQNGQRNYPPYANGPGYVLSSDIARFIVEEFERYRLRLFKMEDVSVGMWVEHFKNSSNPVDYRHSLRFCQFGCVENYYTAHLPVAKTDDMLMGQALKTKQARVL